MNKQERIREIERTIIQVSKLITKLEKQNSKIGWIRFSIFVTGSVGFLILFFTSLKTLAILDIIVFTALFTTASIFHNRITLLMVKYKKWAEIKRANLARANLNWHGIPFSKNFSTEELNNIEIDLDLTGENSLHRLIDTAKSKEGSELLRKFLIEMPASHEEIIHRQNLVKELLALSHFRDKFLLTSSLASKNEFDSDLLIHWFSKPDNSKLIIREFIVLCLLAAVNIVFILLAITGIVPKVFFITSAVYFSVYFMLQKSIKSFASEAEIVNGQMKKIIGIFSFVGDYNFGSKNNLKTLCSPLTNKESGPDRKLNQINSVLTVLTMRSNVLWFGLMLVFPIDFFLAHRIEVLKKEISKNLKDWLEAWHKLEVYVSIANYAYLNPEYAFPVLVDVDWEKSKILFDAEDIGHPLITYDKNIKNSFCLSEPGTITLLTGSNMAGKSTFLRTIGANKCLANIGSPVNAKSCSVSLSRIFTCIKVSDSVTDGISYFYAEVRRLRKLLDEIEKENKLPLVFLIDEIFKGTNNIERHTGSRAVLKALLNKNGSGIISTHDLELVKLADEFPGIFNFHFREEVNNGQMIFDYKLCQGPCPTTNALKIMKAAGLPVG